jgi:hypothetical protein
MDGSVDLSERSIKPEMSTKDRWQTDSARRKAILLDFSNAFTAYRKEEYQ